jgi:S-adenosylmethionine:tRNA ribosyltransferase-isomerase
VPLPPYIKQELEDPERYQTIYSKNLGSIAAPTAGLHFTPELLKTLEGNGIRVAYITLHISYGTFTPVHTEDITQHKMDREYAIMTKKNSDIINQVYKSKREDTEGTGGRLVAVGTTAVRTLETIALNSSINNLSKSGAIKQLTPWEGWTELFIYPGFKFKAGIDILITNFHLPKSTLIMLVTAFAGHSPIIKAYKEAIEKKYRFYSLGDAMMIIK